MNVNFFWIIDFCKQFNIKVKFDKSLYCGGQADVHTRTICLNTKYLSDNWYTVDLVCHEVCHILGHDHKKFYNYYHYKNGKSDHIRKIGLKAERYTDKMAMKMLRSLYIDAKYYKPRLYSKAWYHKTYLNVYFPKLEVKI